jgi:PEGA domain
MKRACILILAMVNLASLAVAQPSGRATEIQESLQSRYRLTRIGPGALGLRGGENSIRHAGGVVVLRKEGLFGTFKRNQMISMSITGEKVEVLSGSRETGVPLAVGARFYVVAVSVSSDAVTLGLLSTESITSGAQTGQLWASLNFFFDKELIQRGDVSRIYPEIDEWLLPEGFGAPLALPPPVSAAPMQPRPAQANPSQPKMETAANSVIISLHAGMGRNEVLALLGNPAREITFGDRRWLQYPGMTAAFNKDALTSIDANAAPATMKITSEPEGAEIYIDGSLTGTTPSIFNIAAGAHKISVKQAGFQNWEREVQVLAGSDINFRATLSK